MATSADYIDSIRRYTEQVEDRAVQAIVRHLGIALQSRDGSLVDCSDKDERDRVRDKWLKRKLGICDPDASLDQAVQDVCQAMSSDRKKCRVTFYYLLAAKYGKLDSL